MSLNKSEIEKIAWLARLALDAGETTEFSHDLSNILNLIEQMTAVDTTNIKPLAHPVELDARLRPDEVTETDQREKFLSCAPSVENGLYLVPKVIE